MTSIGKSLVKIACAIAWSSRPKLVVNTIRPGISRVTAARRALRSSAAKLSASRFAAACNGSVPVKGNGDERARMGSTMWEQRVTTGWQIETTSPMAQWLEAKKKIVVVVRDFSLKDFSARAGLWANCRVAWAGKRLGQQGCRAHSGQAWRLSPPPEQSLDVGKLQFHIGRPAVVALAGIRHRLHLAQERVHLLGLEAAAGAHRAVAGHGGGDMHQPVLERQCLVPFRHVLGEVAHECLYVDLAEQGRRLAHCN